MDKRTIALKMADALCNELNSLATKGYSDVAANEMLKLSVEQAQDKTVERMKERFAEKLKKDGLLRMPGNLIKATRLADKIRKMSDDIFESSFTIAADDAYVPQSSTTIEEAMLFFLEQVMSEHGL